MGSFVVVYEDTGLRTRSMSWVDCCLAASKMCRRGQRCEIMPATRLVLEAFQSGPACVDEMVSVVLSAIKPIVRPLPNVLVN